MNNITSRYVFKFLRRKAKKYPLKPYLVWFLPWEKTIVHVSLSRKTGSAVFRNRIRRIIKGHCAEIKKLPRGIYIFKGLVGCSIAESKNIWAKLLNFKSFITYGNKHIAYNDYKATNHNSNCTIWNKAGKKQKTIPSSTKCNIEKNNLKTSAKKHKRTKILQGIISNGNKD